MKKILVLCTGNSCRSIIAEALINYLAGGSYVAFSAGSNPSGYVHPNSILALKKNGISTDSLRSKSWDEFNGENFDIVLTVCDSAASEVCPVFIGEQRKLHWSIEDPAKIKGDEGEINDAFDETFNLIKNRIESELL